MKCQQLPNQEHKVLKLIKVIEKKIDPHWRAPDSSYGSINKWNVEYLVQELSISAPTNALIGATVKDGP